jgi:hypothetical protein
MNLIVIKESIDSIRIVLLGKLCLENARISYYLLELDSLHADSIKCIVLIPPLMNPFAIKAFKFYWLEIEYKKQ